MGAGKAAGKTHECMSECTAWGGCVTGTAADGFTRVKEPSAGPIAAAGGDARRRGSHNGAIVHAGRCIVVPQPHLQKPQLLIRVKPC